MKHKAQTKEAISRDKCDGIILFRLKKTHFLCLRTDVGADRVVLDWSRVMTDSFWRFDKMGRVL